MWSASLSVCAAGWLLAHSLAYRLVASSDETSGALGGADRPWPSGVLCVSDRRERRGSAAGAGGRGRGGRHATDASRGAADALHPSPGGGLCQPHRARVGTRRPCPIGRRRTRAGVPCRVGAPGAARARRAAARAGRAGVGGGTRTWVDAPVVSPPPRTSGRCAPNSPDRGRAPSEHSSACIGLCPAWAAGRSRSLTATRERRHGARVRAPEKGTYARAYARVAAVVACASRGGRTCRRGRAGRFRPRDASRDHTGQRRRRRGIARPRRAALRRARRERSRRRPCLRRRGPPGRRGRDRAAIERQCRGRARP